MTGQDVNSPKRKSRTGLKCGVLLFVLFAIQVPLVLVNALAHDGCTKFVPLGYVQSLVDLAWKESAWSLGAHLVVLLLFMSDFLRSPRALMSKPALIAGICFVVWKVTALAVDLKHASRCGEGRAYPEILPWMSLDLLFFLGLFTWVVLIVTALRATAYASQWRSG